MSLTSVDLPDPETPVTHVNVASGIRTGIPLRLCSRGLWIRSEEHTSELQSRLHLVCRLLLEKKKYRSSRFGYEFTVLFIDLDHFKQVNDTHGHLIGSKLLAEIGYLIKAQLRLIDYAFRYGGDEFVILLPQTGKDPALVVARRLRDTLRTSTFCQEEGLNLNVRASMGVATFPHDAKTPHDIIRQADEMMYLVKNTSRDNIGIAQRGVMK